MADNKYTPEVDFSPIADLLQEKGLLKKYKKGEFFTHLSGRSDYMGYVSSGAFRYISTDSAGIDKVVGYSFSEGYVGNYATFQQKIFSNVGIQAICDSSVYILSYAFYEMSMENQRFGRRIAEILFLEIYDRLISIYSMSPRERYIEILKRCPDLLNMIPLKELASYLMITPETLSRIRKEILTK